MDHSKELTHISLCAGYGGIDLGLSRALGTVRTVAFVEIESFATANLVAKIEAGWLDRAPVHSDLKTFPYSAFRGRVDILSGGFPCQPFSTAGRRAGDEDPRHLWPYITKGIRALGLPPLVFFENVEGIISSKLKGDGWADPEGTPVLLHVLRELERLGYTATAGVFSASEVGAPHQRKRVFILGCRSDLSEAGRGLVDGLLRDTEREQASDTWPASRGAEQYPWEPPRVAVDNADSARSLRSRDADTAEATERWDAEIRHLTKTGPHDRSGLGNTDNERLQGSILPSEPRGSRQANKEPVTGSSSRRDIQRQIESSMGGDADGYASGVGYAELCHTVDNRTDELRLLGNGVVPATAERAFRVLWGQIQR